MHEEKIDPFFRRGREDTTGRIDRRAQFSNLAGVLHLQSVQGIRPIVALLDVQVVVRITNDFIQQNHVAVLLKRARPAEKNDSLAVAELARTDLLDRFADRVRAGRHHFKGPAADA